ncbi:D-alanyl-D-alanine carboxypeptidase/D-alanyl-D-alanine endopeptidase [Paeniglutamicibacter gangotriensis]|uniref:D-alanyl-D-alanine carboxypeptidase n=1 Tax=Paeniglutamicibacter gangotriensis Lz1y TaxID=1276920 RepID=M7MYI6_9MICC|nr:D-alanyl-D-alanine carboxypeptidase/D-alanyl-D-alanine-endopeptidase [Paeniglutamicibacter gangotriensis]EMR00011.1 D-alanyl-D-alanine carboxypeptidase [Paeniglutamicibacter gangotriensis Lz1y]
MKQARQIMRMGMAAVVAGLVLGLVVFLLIPVAFPGPAPDSTPASPAPEVLAAAEATALPPLDPEAPTPDTAALKSALDTALTAGAAGATVTGAVIDVATGRELYSRSGDEPGIPASSLKVLTAIAATHELGEEHRFTTKTLLTGTDTVVLVGGGDVLLGTGKDSGAVSGRASLDTLAQDTAKALEEAQTAGTVGNKLRIELDESLFSGPALNPAWDSSLVTTHNISPISPLAMYGARATADPKAERVADPGLYAAAAFSRALGAALADSGSKLTLSGEPTRTQGAAEGTELASIDSATLGEQVRFMLEDSDNYVAESLGRLVAVARQEPGDHAHGAAAVGTVVEGLGIDTSKMALVDTSGLAHSNRVSPLTLASALGYAATSEHASLCNLGYRLPVAGATGTMSNRLGAQSTRGIVRAKTGSLLEVSSLSGLTVSRDGRALAFSFFVHTTDGAIAPHKHVLDAAAAALTGCGCR